MSKIRMCDRPECGLIFKEGAEGSTQMAATINHRYDDGSRNTQSESMALCPKCADLMLGGSAPVPMTSLPGTADVIQ